jgi:hypothetical protein
VFKVKPASKAQLEFRELQVSKALRVFKAQLASKALPA